MLTSSAYTASVIVVWGAEPIPGCADNPVAMVGIALLDGLQLVTVCRMIVNRSNNCRIRIKLVLKKFPGVIHHVAVSVGTYQCSSQSSSAIYHVVVAITPRHSIASIIAQQMCMKQ